MPGLPRAPRMIAASRHSASLTRPSSCHRNARMRHFRHRGICTQCTAGKREAHGKDQCDRCIPPIAAHFTFIVSSSVNTVQRRIAKEITVRCPLAPAGRGQGEGMEKLPVISFAILSGPTVLSRVAQYVSGKNYRFGRGELPFLHSARSSRNRPGTRSCAGRHETSTS